MKIYRGPKSKNFSDSSHIEVDAFSIEERLIHTVNNSFCISANISKNAIDRHSNINMFLDENEIILLHTKLIEKLFEQANSHKTTIARIDEIKRILSECYELCHDISDSCHDSNCSSFYYEIKKLMGLLSNAIGT